MRQFRRRAAPALVVGLVMAAACSAPAMAGAYTVWVARDCGAGLDVCTQACDYDAVEGPLLGRCNDYCLKRAGVCAASQIPVPAGHRSHSRYLIGRK
jgi:hypothetical protein